MPTFDPKAVKRWRRDVWREFEKMGFDAIKIQAALVLAGVVAVGTHVSSLSEITGLSEGYVTKVLRRLRKHRVISGQRLRVAWDQKDCGWMAICLDAMVATGELTRPPDEKRSAAQKARAPETRARGPRKPRTVVTGPYVPQQQAANPLYGLAEWETKR